MKKTYPTNINGRIFYIDEDAYSLMQNYIHQLHDTFGGEEGREIVGDIEARIAELFDERIASGASVITLADVNRVIETMGRPEDISDGPEEGAHREEPREQKPFVTFNLPGRKRLFRNMQNRVFGGVVSGVGTYLGWDISIMRLALVILALFTYFWPVTVVYLIAWMVIPPARSSRQILEMYGEPINVENVGQTILRSQPAASPYAESDEAMSARAKELGKKDKSDFFSTLVRVCANLIMGFFGLIALLCGIAFGMAIIAIVAALTASLFTSEIPPMLTQFGGMSPRLACMTALAALCFLLIPCIGIVWGAASMIFNAPAAGKKTIISLVVLDMIFLALSIALGVALSACMA